MIAEISLRDSAVQERKAGTNLDLGVWITAGILDIPTRGVVCG